MSFLAPLAIQTGLQMLTHHATAAAQDGFLAAEEVHQTALMGRAMAHQAVMDERSEKFNEAIQERAELMRERELLTDIAISERKVDDKITKEWIGLIRGQ